jgi:hypothetical protein
MVAVALFGSELPFRTWLGGLGLVSALAILLGTLEPAGFEPAADIVVVGYILWSIWLLLFGALVLRTEPLENRVAETSQASPPTFQTEHLAGRPS